MSLSHLVAEAKKNTPSLGPKTVSETRVEENAPPHVQRIELRRKMAEISEGDKAVSELEKAVPSWKQCQYLKSFSERAMCSQYMSLCAKEKCHRKFMEASFFDFKKYLKQGKPIK